MKTRYVIGLSVAAGVALGAIAIQGLHAQAKPPGFLVAKPPVYFVADIDEVTNPEGWKSNSERSTGTAAELIKGFGGRYLTRTGQITALDGTAPKRLIIIMFDSVEKAQAFYNSPAQNNVNEIRMKNTNSRAFLVEGE
jgi:uncharacterized protein (DUF1330 family)